MAGQAGSDIGSLVSRNEQTILPEWIELQKKAGILHTGRITEGELQSQSRNFLHLLRDALAKGGSDAADPAYEPARAMLERPLALSGLAGLFSERNRHLHLLAQAAAVQRLEPRPRAVGGPGCIDGVDDHVAAR